MIASCLLLLLPVTSSALDCSLYGFERLDQLYEALLPIEAAGGANMLPDNSTEDKSGGCILQRKAYVSPCSPIGEIEECEGSHFCVVETLTKKGQSEPHALRAIDKFKDYVETIEFEPESLVIRLNEVSGSRHAVISFRCSDSPTILAGYSEEWKHFAFRTPNMCESKKTGFAFRLRENAFSLEHAKKVISIFGEWLSQIARNMLSGTRSIADASRDDALSSERDAEL